MVRQQAAVDDACPDLVGERERRRAARLRYGAGLGGQGGQAVDTGQDADLGPGGGMVARSRGEGPQQAPDVHVQRQRVDDALETVGGHVARARDAEPAIVVALGQAQGRADDLAEHRPQVRARVLGVVDLGAESGLADGEAPGHGRRRHPDVDAELAHVGRPVVLRQVVVDEVATDAEVAADRLADAQPVERSRERVGDRVGDRAVELVARVERGRVVEAALEDGPGQELDPLRSDRAQVRVDDHEGLDLQRPGDLEERSQRRALAAHAIDLRVGQADAPQAVARPDQEDGGDVVGRLRLHDDPLCAVGRAGVGVDEDRPQVGEVLDEAGMGGPHDVADGGGVPKARDADHDVGRTEALDLAAERLGQAGQRSRARSARGMGRAAALALGRGCVHEPAPIRAAEPIAGASATRAGVSRKTSAPSGSGGGSSSPAGSSRSSRCWTQSRAP